MQIGLGLNSHGVLTRDDHDAMMRSIPVQEMRPLELAELAERRGYHSVWIPDHIFVKADPLRDTPHPANASGKRAYPVRPVMMDQLTTMAAVLARTRTLKVASSVLIAPYRHPLGIAHEFATIDQLSEGRVIMGVGCGWSEAEFVGLGLDTFAHRNEVTEECIDVYRLSWEEPVLEYHGRFFDFEELSMDPKPYQGRRIPIYAGGTFRVAARRAVRKCDGFYPMFLDPAGRPARFTPLIEDMRREADAIGRDMTGFELLAMCSALVTDADDPYARKDYLLTGSAEQVLEHIQEFADHGYSHLTLHFDVRDGGGAELFELVERFAEEVLPEAAKIQHTPAF